MDEQLVLGSEIFDWAQELGDLRESDALDEAAPLGLARWEIPVLWVV